MGGHFSQCPPPLPCLLLTRKSATFSLLKQIIVKISESAPRNGGLLICPSYAIIDKIIFFFNKTFPESMQEILKCRINFNEQKKRVCSRLVREEKRGPKRFTRTNAKASIHVKNHLPQADLINSINKTEQVGIYVKLSRSCVRLCELSQYELLPGMQFY